MPIQGTSADILKRALRLIHDDLRGTSGKLVNIVHDEIVLECDEADSTAVSEKLRSAMIAAAGEFVRQYRSTLTLRSALIGPNSSW